MKTSQYHRSIVAVALQKLAQDIRFTGGKPALPRENEAVSVGVSLGGIEDGLARHHVTVFAGLPAPPEVEGLLCTLRRADTGAVVLRTRTNRRGQASLPGLEPIEYRLRVEPRPSFIIPQEATSHIAAHLVGAGSPETAKRLLLDFQTLDGRFRIGVDETVSGSPHLILRIDVEPDAVDDDLVRVEVQASRGQLLAEGIVGLRAGLGGRLSGEVLLDMLSLTHGRPIDTSQIASLQVALELVQLAALGSDSRELLERSLLATTDSRSRGAVEKAIAKLRERS
jgi:hypothetical protein